MQVGTQALPNSRPGPRDPAAREGKTDYVFVSKQHFSFDFPNVSTLR